MNLTTLYYPDLEAVPAEDMALARTFVTTKLQAAFPDVDLSPGTPTGDLVVSVLAMFVAASDIASYRFMSDLQLANVAQGIIYSCDFVSKYLDNFGVRDTTNLRGGGMCRFVFNSPDQVVIPKATRVAFNQNNGESFTLRLVSADSEGITLLAAGTHNPATDDTYVLSQISALTWAVDLFLEGNGSTTVTAGTAGTLNLLPAGVVGVTAVADFRSGVAATSLVTLANAARKLAVSRGSGSRRSIVAECFRDWPEATIVSPVLTGDPDMLRGTPGSALILQQPAVDVTIRSDRDISTETQTFRLDYIDVDVSTSGTEVIEKRFRGKLDFLHRPSMIRSVEWSTTTTTSFVDNWTLYSRPTSENFAGETHCGTRQEEFYIDIEPTMTSDIPDIRMLMDGNVPYATFTVVYETDPLLEVMATDMESVDAKQAGVSLLVKSGPLANTTGMVVSYRRRSGVSLLLGNARKEIVAYLRNAGYGNLPTLAGIERIMVRAGASMVTDVIGTVTVQPTPATRLMFNQGTDVVLADPWLHATHSSIIPVYTYAESRPVSNVPSFDVATGGHLWSASARNTRYNVDPDQITFTEL